MLTSFHKRKKNEPLYVSLYKHLKKMIVDLQFIENEKLPSKRKLAQELKISPLTVESAYQQLIAEGYVYSIEKSGYYVAKQIELLQSDKREKKESKRYNRENEKHYQYEFRTNVVDTSLFPNDTWAKLSREVLSEKHHEMLNVTHPQGMRPLRKEIARFLELYRGVVVNEEQIVIGSGTASLLSMIIELLGRDKHYAIENPGYSKLYRLFKGSDVRLALIDVDEQGLNVNELSRSKAEIVHITPSHQFPTGAVMPIQRRTELLNWANGSIKRYIIEDDYDNEFRFQGKPIPALQGFDENDKVIYLNTFTKTLAPSFRMSYMVLPYGLLKKYYEISSYHGGTVPNFEQYIMCKFINKGYFERHINRMRNQYRQKNEKMIKLFAEIDFIALKSYETGLHFLLELTCSMSEEEIIFQLRAKDIWITGLSYYYHGTKKHTKPTLLVGYSGILMNKVEDSTIKLIDALKDIIKSADFA
jgi:GntR family transcriptional regulator/MocR family aminotransferase